MNYSQNEEQAAILEAVKDMPTGRFLDIGAYDGIALGEYGSTDYETSVALKILRTSAGKRRKELCEQGLIVDSKQRRKTDTGSTAVVWRINHANKRE